MSTTTVKDTTSTACTVGTWRSTVQILHKLSTINMQRRQLATWIKRDRCSIALGWQRSSSDVGEQSKLELSELIVALCFSPFYKVFHNNKSLALSTVSLQHLWQQQYLDYTYMQHWTRQRRRRRRWRWRWRRRWWRRWWWGLKNAKLPFSV